MAAITSPTLRTISRGSSGLPVWLAGHTDVQRPQMVQASVSMSCFQVKSSIFDAPKESSSVSIRLGSGFMAPLGRARSRRYMFIGDVNMWRSLVVGSSTRKVRKPAKCSPHTTRWARDRAVADHPSTAAEMGQPTIDHVSNVGRPDEGDPEALGQEPGDTDEEEHAEDDGVLGLRLGPDAVGRPQVAAADGPEDPGQEGDAGQIGGEE